MVSVVLPPGVCQTSEHRSVSLHSLAYPPGYGSHSSHYEESKLVEYWKNVTSVEGITGSFGDHVVSELLDARRIKVFTEISMMETLNNKLELVYNAYYFDLEDGKDYDWNAIIFVCRALSNLIATKCNMSELKFYILVREQLCTLQDRERTFVLKAVEKKVGGLVYMASQCTSKNLRDFQAKLKIANLVPLVHSLFMAPTTLEKISSFYRILELYELPFQDIAWDKIQQLICFIHTVFDWIMTKTRLAYDAVVAGFKWVSTLFTSTEVEPQATVESIDIGDETVVAVVSQTNCFDCSRLASFGCYLCGRMKCADCSAKKYCSCDPAWGDRYHHTTMLSSCAIDLDCFWHAIADQVSLDVLAMKHFVDVETRKPDFQEKFQKFLTQMEYPESAEDLIRMAQNTIPRHIMSDSATLLVAAYVLDIDLHVYIRTNGVLYDTGHKVFASMKKTRVNIFYSPYHYESYKPEGDAIFAEGFGNDNVELANDKEAIGRTLSRMSLDSESSSECEYILRELEQLRDSRTREHSICGTQSEINCEEGDFSSLESVLSETPEGTGFLEWLRNAAVGVIEWFQNNPLVTALTSLVVGCASYFGITVATFKSAPAASPFIDKMVRSSRNIFYSSKGIDGIKNTLVGVVDIAKNMLGVSKNPQLEDFKKRVADAYALAQTMLTVAIQEPGQFVNDGSKFLEFKQQIQDITKVYIDLTKLTPTNELQMIQPLWFALTKTFIELSNHYNKFMAGLSTRQEPVAVWVWGRSDIGKSHLVDFLISKVNKELGEDLKVFTLSKGPSYWNTYCQQSHIKIDDFNAVEDREGDLDAIAFFNLITCAAFNPNMAAISDKNTMANPRFVFVASNYPSIGPTSCITNVEAFERRRHVFLHVSWEEHDKCPRGQYTCEHWKKVIGEDELDENGKLVLKTPKMDNFDHLRVRLCDPNVTNNIGQTRQIKTKNVKGVSYKKGNIGFSQKSEEEIVATGQDVTIDQMVTHIVNKERKARQKFEAVLIRNGVKKQADEPVGVETWSTRPNVALIGAPGVGKSFIMKSIINLKGNSSVLFIDTAALFSDYMKKRTTFKQQTVIFDDLSTFVGCPEFNQFLEAWKERYDIAVGSVPLWIVGLNPNILMAYLQKQHDCSEDQAHEFYDMYIRRCVQIKCLYKSYRDLFFRTRYYTHKETSVPGAKFDELVEYWLDGEKRTQSIIIKILNNIKPQTMIVDKCKELQERATVNPTALFDFPIPSSKFIEMVNYASLMDVKNLITGNIVQVKTSKMTKTQFSIVLMSLYRKAVGMQGCRFDSVADLITECWNADLFSSLPGELLQWNFLDVSFYVDCSTKDVECGYITSPNPTSAIKSMNEMVETIGMSDIMFARLGELPPWITLIGDLIHNFALVATTTLSSVASVHAQKAHYKAAVFQQELDDCLDNAKNSAQNETLNRVDGINQSLGLVDVKKLKPGVKFVKSQQFGDIDEGFAIETGVPVKPPHARQTAPTLNKVKARESGMSNGKPNRMRNNKEYAEQPYDLNMAKTTPAKEFANRQAYVDMQARDSVQDLTVQQVCTDPALPTIVRKIVPNMCEIRDLEKDKKLCYGLFVKDNICTTVLHLLDIKDITELRVITSDGKRWKVAEHSRDAKIDRLDLIVTDPTFSAMCDITNHLPVRDKIVPQNVNAVLVCLDQSFVDRKPTVFMRSYITKGVKQVHFKDGETRHYHHISYAGHRAGFSISGVQTSYGDCGAVLILADSSWQTGKLIGIHVAANTDLAYARHIYRDHYEEIRKEVLKPQVSLDTKWFINSEDEDCVGFAKVPVHCPTKTKLFRNWFPVGEKLFEPCLLSGNDTRNPGHSILTEESMKWCKERTPIAKDDAELLRQCTRDLATYYGDVLESQNVVLKKLTRTESLNKLQGSSKSEPINLHTSAGYPWNTMCIKKKGKYEFIDLDEDGVRHFSKGPNTQKLYNAMDQYHYECKGQGQATTVFQVSLKDEPVKLKKIYDTPKTRTIAMAPLDYQIEYRRYFHCAHAAIMENWHMLPSKVGINPLSIDWHTLFTKHADISMRGFDIDVQGWDFSHDPIFVEMICEFWQILYARLDPHCTQFDQDMRSVLYSKIINFLLLVGRKVYRSTGGIPSGYPGTSPDNTIVHNIIAYFSWCKLAKRDHPRLSNLKSFLEDVYTSIYSDDIIYTVSQFAVGFFNTMSVCEQYRSIGFHATPADKSEEMISHKPLQELIFLSRGFRSWNGIMVGPLVMDRLCKGTWWIHDKRSHNFWESPDDMCTNAEVIASSAESHLYEAALHGEQTFLIFRSIALKIWNQTGLSYPMTYREALMRIFGMDPSPTVIQGLTFYDMSAILKMDWIHTLPQHHSVFSNRACYSYGKEYRFVGVTGKSNPFPRNLLKILDYVNEKLDRSFNSLLVNKYPVGGKIPLHKDDETNLDKSEGVFGITIFGDGVMNFEGPNANKSYEMEPGLGYMMDQNCLLNYYHSRTHHKVETMSFTFRRLH